MGCSQKMVSRLVRENIVQGLGIEDAKTPFPQGWLCLYQEQTCFAVFLINRPLSTPLPWIFQLSDASFVLGTASELAIFVAG
ncbi:MAG TPA: hypothetical protein DCS88_13165 [Alphaproteobacteria bacterium]|nr:hypothetical protein [Alphaproteobacteria bacterium]